MPLTEIFPKPETKSSSKNLKVGFYVYPTAFQEPGGGEIQLVKTREYLGQSGIDVKLFDQWTDNFASFDVLHTFGSVKDCLSVIRAAKAKGVKLALSTICWYSWKSSWSIYPDWRGRSTSIVRQFAKEFFPWLSSKRKSMMDLSDILFPNSVTESQQLTRYFGIAPEKIFIVPNGADPSFASAQPDLFEEKYGLKNFILCVGRIEPRKNQLNIIRALKGCPIPLVIMGDYVNPYRSYYESCRLEAGDHVYFLRALPHGSPLLASAYAACNTFLLASWLETPGLAALEAALAGAKIVITREGATQEYFSDGNRDYASYVSPDNLKEIRNKTLATFESSRNTALRNHIQSHFLWSHVAEKTLEGYRRLLKK